MISNDLALQDPTTEHQDYVGSNASKEAIRHDVDQTQLAENKGDSKSDEVIEFLDTYRTLCGLNSSVIIASLQKSLQNAIDGAETPKVLMMRGSMIPELKFKRIDDESLECILKPLNNATFWSDVDLSFNEIGNIGASNIALFLKSDLSLKNLSLKSNSIGSTGGIAIAQALHLNESLETLDLSYNAIGDAAGFEFASMLQINNGLSGLDFGGCGLSAGSIIALSTVLLNNTNITHLNLSDNRSNFSTLSQTLQNDTIKHISSMIKQSKSLRQLGLAKLGITDWSTVDLLAPSLMIATTLQHLDLSCNKISRDGAVAICRALHNQISMKSLKLSCCNILDEGAEAVGLMLANNTEIQELYLDYNGITGVGLEDIARGVLANKSLRTLALWGNIWDVGACMAFYQLVGGIVSHSDVGFEDDKLPDTLHAKNLRKLQSGKPGQTTIIDSRAYTNADTTQGVDQQSRLEKSQVDFVIYSVEGVLNVGRRHD